MFFRKKKAMERMAERILVLASEKQAMQERLDRYKDEEEQLLGNLTDMTSRWIGEVKATHVVSNNLRQALAAVERIRESRSNHPECDKHDEADPVTCGWKRTVQDIDKALEKPVPSIRRCLQEGSHRTHAWTVVTWTGETHYVCIQYAVDGSVSSESDVE